MIAPDRPSDIYLTSPGFEAALTIELGAGEAVAPGVVLGPARALPETERVFARQVLPGASLVSGASVAQLAEGAFERCAPRLDADPTPWRCDVFVPDDPDEPGRGALHGARSQLLAARFLELLDKKRRRASRRRVEDDPRVLRVQLLLAEREQLWVSVARPIVLPCGALWPSPLVAGRASIAEDRRAPSTAYRKLREALAWMELTIQAGERCVDLGASPGGWSHVALSSGAQVVAVDRAELDPIVAGHRALVHARADAFRFEPDAPPVDWMLSDVIAEPEKSAELLLRWTERRWYRHAVVHLKFKGQERYGIARDLIEQMSALGVVARAKHLAFDKNEITVLVRSVRSAPAEL